jgi:hypothetical protein
MGEPKGEHLKILRMMTRKQKHCNKKPWEFLSPPKQKKLCSNNGLYFAKKNLQNKVSTYQTIN